MKVRVAGFSVSLDGFGAGPEQSLENPLGKRGRELHQWFFGTRMFRTSGLNWQSAELTARWPYRSTARAEDTVDQVGNSLLIEWRVRHQSAKEDRAEQRERCDLRMDARREVSGSDPVGDQRDERFARLGLEMMMKPPHCTISLRSLDESRKTRREGRICDDTGNVVKNALKFLAWCARNKLRVSLLLKQLERIGDQADLVWPMAVDRRFAHAGSTSSGLYGERAVTQFAQLVEHRL